MARPTRYTITPRQRTDYSPTRRWGWEGLKTFVAIAWPTALTAYGCYIYATVPFPDLRWLTVLLPVLLTLMVWKIRRGQGRRRWRQRRDSGEYLT